MKTLVRLPHLEPPARPPHTGVAVTLIGGTYGLTLAMLLLGIAPEVCVATTGAITALAVHATRSLLPLDTGHTAPGAAAQPPRP
ncbi:hypothetical protein [Plantactinospora sp. WMMB782]|uniref:hypothetical protein n=1 Tax=Plantactinospora sp. WMMB782 TaxID=3404121 RepID=UPI003B9272EC